MDGVGFRGDQPAVARHQLGEVEREARLLDDGAEIAQRGHGVAGDAQHVDVGAGGELLGGEAGDAQAAQVGLGGAARR